tara:strand:- start:769 stop:1839 length:1071 start_codon:yes stop_codon:yes gene_type:complete
MLLTICLPVFNDSRALSTTIESLLSQKIEWGTTAEILVSDNFSEDNAAEQAKRQLAQTSGSRVFRQSENLGFLGNLRFLSHAATGEYIWFIGAGDTVVDDSLEIILGILATKKFDWGTVRALFDFHDNTGYFLPEQVLEACDSQEISKVAVFNHAISMNIVRRKIFTEFTSCLPHRSSSREKIIEPSFGESRGSLDLWESETCYWPHLEAIAMFCSAHSGDKLSWFEYHEISVLLSDNKNGNWDKGLSAFKIYGQWIQVVSMAHDALGKSSWLDNLERELKNLHLLRFTFMVKKDGNLRSAEIARELWASDTSQSIKVIASLICWTPSLLLKLLAQLRALALSLQFPKAHSSLFRK